MKTKLKNISDVKVELTISLGTEELKAAEQVALTKLAKEVKIEGFRKGKAPLELVAAQVDQTILGQETLENALSKAVAEAFLKEDIKAIDRPEVDVKKFIPGTELEFTATTEIMPKVELGDYKNLKVKNEYITIKANKEIFGYIKGKDNSNLDKIKELYYMKEINMVEENKKNKKSDSKNNLEIVIVNDERE